MAQSLRYIFPHRLVRLMFESAREETPQGDAILLHDLSEVGGAVEKAYKWIHQLTFSYVIEKTADLFQIMLWDIDGQGKLYVQCTFSRRMTSPGAEHPCLQVTGNG